MLEAQTDLHKLEEHGVFTQELPVLVLQVSIQVTLLHRLHS